MTGTLIIEVDGGGTITLDTSVPNEAEFVLTGVSGPPGKDGKDAVLIIPDILHGGFF